MDFGFLYARHELVCNKKVVDAPTDVSVARASLHIPVCISALRVGVEMPERVDITGANDFIYPCTLFGQKACIFFVFFRSCEIYLLVGGVYIAAEYNGFLLA